MTQDEIIRFAIQCRLVTTGNRDGLYMDALTEFAHLVAAKEREALAQTQEPVAIVHRNEYNEYRLEPHDNFDIKSIPFNVDVPLFKSPQPKEPEPEHEPVAKYSDIVSDGGLDPRNTNPPQRSEPSGKPSAWVGLTDKQTTQAIKSMPKGIKGWMIDWDLHDFSKAIEAKLKEKNT